MMILLARKFPMLPFADTAESWLDWAQEVSIFEQLQSRRILSVQLIPACCDSDLAVTANPKNHFSVVLNAGRKFEDAFFNIGREVGRTFLYDLTRKPPRLVVNKEFRGFFYHVINGEPQGSCVADFCNEFARRWLLINTKEAVQDCCRDRESVIAGTLLLYSQARREC